MDGFARRQEAGCTKNPDLRFDLARAIHKFANEWVSLSSLSLESVRSSRATRRARAAWNYLRNAIIGAALDAVICTHRADVIMAMWFSKLMPFICQWRCYSWQSTRQSWVLVWQDQESKRLCTLRVASTFSAQDHHVCVMRCQRLKHESKVLKHDIQCVSKVMPDILI